MREPRGLVAASLAVAAAATAALVACGSPRPPGEHESGNVRAVTTGWMRCADVDEPLPAARDRCRWEPVASTARLPDGLPMWLERELGEEILRAARRHPRAGVDEAAAPTVALGAWLEVFGAVTLYADGVPVAAWGEPELAGGAPPSAERFRTLVVRNDPAATLALRYEPHAKRGLGWLSSTNGLNLRLGEPLAVQEAWRRFTRVASGHQLAFTAAFTTQALLHLLIFAFSRRVRSNAWFAVSCLLSASLVYVQFEVALAQDLDRLEWLYRIWGPLLLADMGVLLSFVYEAFDHPRRAWFWLLEAVAVVLGVYSFVVSDVNAFVDFWWFHLVVLVESVRVNVLAVRRGWSGAWIIAVGLLLLGCGLVWQQLLAQGKLEMPLPIFPVAYYGVAALLVSVSTYLSFHVGRLGRILRERLQQVEELSAKSLQQEREAKDLELSRRLLEVENERKTEELEAARAFQLSLLPRELPRVDGVEIAATMETATEVGGDYYDATVWPDGSLVILMGDATGHGARAGSLVSLMKGMFVTLRPGEDLGRFLADASVAVRSMHLDRARLAMALLRLDGERLTFAAAGMPPALVVRARTGEVEELMTPAMPLGGLSRRFPERETEIQAGDTVFLLSDGLFELPDRHGDPLGYERVRALVAETARDPDRGADAVVKELFDHARRWYGEGAYPDDITVVVLRSLAVPPGEQKGLVEAAAEHALSSF